jgi:hypothetical protein
VGEEHITAAGAVVYLLAEVRSAGGHGTVHAIGSRARVLRAEGDRLTLAIESGGHQEEVTCRRALVAPAERSLAARRRALRSGPRRR